MKNRETTIRLLIAVIVAVVFQACALVGGDPSRIEEKIDAAIAKGDTAKALKYLNAIVHSDTADAERYMQMGAIYRATNSIRGRHQSHQILELGLQRFPDHMGLLLEMGKTQYARTFYPDAANRFERVLELDPDNCEAHFYTGLHWYRKWKHVQIYREYLGTARSHFSRVAECDPANKDAFFKLAVSNLALGDTTAASAVLDRFLHHHEKAHVGYFLQAAIAYYRSDYERAQALVEQGFSNLSEEEQRGYRDISLLMTEDEDWVYEHASDEKRRTMERVFWAELDPDPTTQINEKFLEHTQRMFLADTFFGHDRPPLRGWETERGRALIKFGWPDGVGSTLEGESLSGRMEVWTYSNEFVGMKLFFRDEFLNGNYMVPMDYRYSHSAQTLYLDPPASKYVSPYWEIPGVIDVLAFRNGTASTDVYLAMKVDLEAMREHVDLSAADPFVARTAVFDDEWQPHLQHTDTLRGEPFSHSAHNGYRWHHIVRVFDLPFALHHVAFCLEDGRARTQTILTGEKDTAPYLSDSLTLSDVLLYQSPSRDLDDTALIHRGGKSFQPNPGGDYAPPQKLRVYVEIYNLEVTGSESRYEITYSIFDAEEQLEGWSRIRRGLKNMMGFRSPPDPVISHVLSRSGTRHEAAEDLAIDIGALLPGDYLLQISVHDRSSEQFTERTKRFTKENVRPAEE